MNHPHDIRVDQQLETSWQRLIEKRMEAEMGLLKVELLQIDSAEQTVIHKLIPTSLPPPLPLPLMEILPLA